MDVHHGSADVSRRISATEYSTSLRKDASRVSIATDSWHRPTGRNVACVTDYYCNRDYHQLSQLEKGGGKRSGLLKNSLDKNSQKLFPVRKLYKRFVFESPIHFLSPKFRLSSKCEFFNSHRISQHLAKLGRRVVGCSDEIPSVVGTIGLCGRAVWPVC